MLFRSIKVEIKPGHESEWPDLKVKLAKDLAEAHEGLRFSIERVDYGVLPHFELKAKRLVDVRPVAQY